MSSLVVHPLQPDDYDQWLHLWNGYLEFYKEKIPNQVTAETWRRLLAIDEEPHGLGAYDADGRLIGFVHYIFHSSTWSLSSYCYLEDLYVDANARGSGAGRALIEGVYEDAGNKSAAKVYWYTQESNKVARHLYDQLGELTEFVQYKKTF